MDVCTGARKLCKVAQFLHPSVYQKFESGAFVVNKTKHAFSSVALDHAAHWIQRTSCKEVVESVKNIQKVGQDQYKAFVTEKIIQRTKPITDPIKRSRLPLFSRLPIKVA